MKQKPEIIFLFMMMLFLSSCQSQPISQEVALQETQSPSATATATNTMTPTLTATVTPTVTPSPTQTSTPLGGGAGKFLFNVTNNWGTDDWVTNIYLYDIVTDSLSLLLSGFTLDEVSPTGETILISQFDEEKGVNAIYSYDIESNNFSLLFDGFNLKDVSPSGDKILITKFDNDDSHIMAIGDLYVAGLDALELTRLSSEFIRYLPAGWLKNTNSIIFAERQNGITQLLFLDSDGNTTVVTNSSVGVLDFRPELVNGGIYWEEGYSTRTGSWSLGWRWTELTSLETHRLSNGIAPFVSPDSRFVAELGFFEDNVVITDMVTSTQIQVFLEDLIADYQSENHYYIDNLFWFPGSQNLFIEVGVCRPSCGTESVLILSKEGVLIKDLLFGGISIQAIRSNALWSPDGTKALFYCYPALCLLDVESMTLNDLPNIESLEPDWINRFLWLP